MRFLEFLLIVITINTQIYSQIDTIALKKTVMDISTEREHIEFWQYIHQRDQDMRRRSGIQTIDQENLVLVSYYLNFFGYPDHNILGRESSIINYVWIHNRSFDVKKITFPIIHQAYMTQSINEKDLREYFLRVLYQRYFDDRGNYTKPIRTIFKELEVNLSEQINITELIRTLERYNVFTVAEKDTIGIWRSRSHPDTFVVNNKTFVKEIQGVTVMIFKSSNGRIYFMHNYTDGSYDPIELEVLDEKSNTYKYKFKISQDYYRIRNDGNLEFMDDGGRRVLEYLKKS